MIYWRQHHDREFALNQSQPVTTVDSTYDAARLAVDAAVDRQATDIVMLDLRQLTDFTDYFVICSAGSSRQIKAVADAVDQAVSLGGLALKRREGDPESGWLVLDFGDVIVHVFAPEEREYYRLDRIWKDAVPVVQIQ